MELITLLIFLPFPDCSFYARYIIVPLSTQYQSLKLCVILDFSISFIFHLILSHLWLTDFFFPLGESSSWNIFSLSFSWKYHFYFKYKFKSVSSSELILNHSRKPGLANDSHPLQNPTLPSILWGCILFVSCSPNHTESPWRQQTCLIHFLFLRVYQSTWESISA